MKILRVFAILLLVVALASCASQSPRTNEEPVTGITNERILPYPMEVTWSAVADVFSSRTWTVESEDANRRSLASGRFELPGGAVYCACRSGRRSETRACRGELRVQLKWVSANGTRVTIESDLEARDAHSREPDWIPCSSSGQLETELFAAIDSVVAARGM